jgi:hypothetical protein
VTEEDKARLLAEKPHCIDFRVFEDSLIGVEMRKLRHNINKPFQHGFCVLEWSKYKMYKFYALLKDAFQDKVRMLYTDTDSFFLQFFVDDLPQELKSRGVYGAFDFSSISYLHPTKLHSNHHEGEVGYFKDECNGDQIVEFVGLRPKMYSFTVMDARDPDPRLPPLPVNIKHKSVAKGISRANIRRFTHEDYLTMFREGDSRKVTNRRIGSKLHQVLSLIHY